MATATEAAAIPAGGAPAGGGSSSSKLGLLLVLVNTVVIVAVMGLMVYTRLLFKRPKITESSERARLEQVKAAPVAPQVPGMVTFDPFTVNIESMPAAPKANPDGPQGIQGKLHYANIGFALEIRDMNHIADVESIRPVLLDKIVSMVGRRGFHELTTVQGRYLLRAQILDHANQMMERALGKTDTKKSDAFVTNVFFTQFIVQ